MISELQSKLQHAEAEKISEQEKVVPVFKLFCILFGNGNSTNCLQFLCFKLAGSERHSEAFGGKC